MTREEKISHLKGILSEINENDNAVCYLTSEDNELIESAVEALSQESCYNPDEWCHDCSEYNQDKHCCPRFNNVIRKTVEEIKRAKIKVGHWIEGQTDNPNIHNILCSCCFEGYQSKGHANSQYTKDKFQWCPKCGAKMVEPQESES
jgi:hypothetical protein